MRRATLPLLACLASGCLLDVDAPDFSILTDFQFATSGEAWESGVVDYPAADEAAVGFLGDRRPRPAESGSTDLALYLRGDNVSNDLFMYWSRRYAGLFPEQTYSVTIDLEYLSDASRDCTTGPGPVTWLKLGLAGVEPLRFLDQDNWYRLSLDKGQQGQGSATTVVLGDIRNNRAGCTAGAPYTAWARQTLPEALVVRASAEGTVWIIVGTESAFAGPHDIYLSRLRLRWRPVPD